MAVDTSSQDYATLLEFVERFPGPNTQRLRTLVDAEVVPLNQALRLCERALREALADVKAEQEQN